MNINMEFEKVKQYGRAKWVRLLIVPTLALALGGSVAAYKFATPAAANAAMAAPPAAPLDADSVAPLIALNRAMETLAARVTPAVVNVTVTSRTKPDATQGQMPEGMEQFFGQFFGPNGGPNGGCARLSLGLQYSRHVNQCSLDRDANREALRRKLSRKDAWNLSIAVSSGATGWSHLARAVRD